MRAAVRSPSPTIELRASLKSCDHRAQRKQMSNLSDRTVTCKTKVEQANSLCSSVMLENERGNVIRFGFKERWWCRRGEQLGLGQPL
jgi:hypothetical protein